MVGLLDSIGFDLLCSITPAPPERLPLAREAEHDQQCRAIASVCPPALFYFEAKQYKRVLATHSRPSFARMIPKSGYRFSDKIMRKKDRSQNRPAEQDRVTPEPAVEPAFGSIMLQRFV
jgi:hypothetical protein